MYSTDGLDEFVDNFHTCLVIKNLVKIGNLTARSEVMTAVERGYSFYRNHLLDSEGLPMPFAVRPRFTLYRRDLYDFAEGINLAVLLMETGGDVGRYAESVADTLIGALLKRWTLPDGHFVTRMSLLGRNTVPYHRWAQAQTIYALVRYCVSVGRVE
jgi:hypothetical protein